MHQNEWELFTGQLGSAAGVSETGRPRGFPPWASPDRAEAFALLAEYLPNLVQAADLADAERWGHVVSDVQSVGVLVAQAKDKRGDVAW